MTDKATEYLKQKAEAFEIVESEGKSLRVAFENDRLNEIQQGENSGVGIRAVKSGRIGFSYSSKPGEHANVAESAVRLAPYGKPYAFQFAPKAENTESAPFDPACGDIAVQNLVELGNEVQDIIKSADPDATADSMFGGSVSNSRIVTSQGQDCRLQDSSFGFMVLSRFTEEGNFVQVYRANSSPHPISREQIIQSAREAAEEAGIARKVVPFKGGTYKVLLSPHAVADILRPITVSINGINIARKTSRFVESLGEKLFDERLTLLDDPFHPDGPGGVAYDGEGIVTRRRPIVEKGVLRGFAHTLTTAQQSGHEPTGNAQRSVSSQPMPGLHNLVMEPGEHARAELMKQAEGGLYIGNMLGTFTSNFLAGQVSGNVSLGFPLEGGHKTGRVKNCALNVNGFDLLSERILGISKEREWVGDSLLPWMLVDAVTISTRT
jgi:PmbA protein